MERVFNFNAGPAVLPEEVLTEAAAGVLEINGSGMSILEVSHRASDFSRINDECEALVRELLDVPQNYKILFLTGGASTQFALVPMNLLPEGGTAEYVDTGTWASKAIKEAARFGKVHVAGSSKDAGYTFIPDELNRLNGASYLHITSNNTIFGTQYRAFPRADTLVADMSSDIMSRPVDVGEFGLIYAGAQKNIGPAGVTLVIIREDVVGKSKRSLPAMFTYATHIPEKSLYNTPPVFAIYVMNLVLRWIKAQGGVAAVEEANLRKAKVLYAAIDEIPLYRGCARFDSRSLMNVTFRLKDEAREAAFLAEAKDRRLVGLKGHRSVGGVRASIYNAMPEAGVNALVEFMRDFAERH